MNLKRSNALRKAKLLFPYLAGEKTVLDFGCGDLALASVLNEHNPRLKITGIDVVDFGVRYPGIKFQQFDGSIVPFPAKSFDTVVAFHVFHHTEIPEKLFAECVRVAKHKIIFVEPVYRDRWEIPGMIFMDWLFNVWKGEKIPMAYNFRSRKWWEKRIENYGSRLVTLKDVEILPKIFPTGRSLLFVVKRL
ncbi:MAG: class I SAM-dependent methyltransferase [Patescibacteria group bacterium]